MAWYDEDSWLTQAVGPNIWAVIGTILLALTLPIVLHWFIYRSSVLAKTPSFLVLGPSGSGKTALVTKLETGHGSKTHTSQIPLTVQSHLPKSTVPKSWQYRSTADYETKAPKPLLLTDTPGHAKLRHYAYNSLASTTNPPTGILFVVDAADLSSSGTATGGANFALSDTAEYLHDVLLSLQKAYNNAKTSKAKEIPFLVAANKLDLFTALPAVAVKSTLEKDITRIRETRARGLLGVSTIGKGEGLGGNDEEGDDEREVLGGTSEGDFKFATMEEWNVSVEVVGGNAVGEDGPGVEGWWEWIGAQL
ncbi:P-loop containing nucleoside triphosphate hydrolase protein [Tothia fuscella]|uniref:Signal recognition particle receptor subunit beta n=1 Tax=Tothia fuscella TaxID=1048955 RepID=A0A9P4U1I2_9PEZI|nr:P-loop containing nucleoside triphosphate hydrolase protein [Tothia fuscella]